MQTTQTEIWKESTHTNVYVSNMGRCKYIDEQDQEYHVSQDSLVYSTTKVKGHNGKCIKINITREVAIAFLGNQHGYKRIYHKNHDLYDMRAENLSWVIPKRERKKQEEKKHEGVFEPYVKAMLERYGNTVIDEKLIKRLGKPKTLEIIKEETGFDCRLVKCHELKGHILEVIHE